MSRACSKKREKERKTEENVRGDITTFMGTRGLGQRKTEADGSYYIRQWII